jgi:hypothetical protein
LCVPGHHRPGRRTTRPGQHAIHIRLRRCFRRHVSKPRSSSAVSIENIA